MPALSRSWRPRAGERAQAAKGAVFFDIAARGLRGRASHSTVKKAAEVERRSAGHLAATGRDARNGQGDDGLFVLLAFDFVVWREDF